MKRNKSIWIMGALLIMILTGCHAAVTNENNPGEESAGKRIITLAPADFEIMYELGAEDLLVGRSDYCDYPQQGMDIESVGECLIPDTESIIALKPDMVIAESSLTKQEILDGLKNAGINVMISHAPQSVEEIYEKIRQLAEVADKKEKGEELIAQMKEEMEKYAVEKLLSSGPAPIGIYYVVDTGEFGEFTATGDTFISEIINAAGRTYNVASEASGWTYTAEQLILDNPDYIIGMEQHIEKIKSTPQYANLKAVRNGHAIAIDINILSRPTARAVLEGIPLLREITNEQN